MGRSAGPADAGNDMKRCAALMLALLIAGCSHTSVQVNSGGTTTTTNYGASVGIGGSGTAAWALIGIGLIAAEIAARRPVQRTDPPAAIEPAQSFDAERRVNEQDCTQPIKDWSANLKCK